MNFLPKLFTILFVSVLASPVPAQVLLGLPSESDSFNVPGRMTREEIVRRKQRRAVEENERRDAKIRRLLREFQIKEGIHELFGEPNIIGESGNAVPGSLNVKKINKGPCRFFALRFLRRCRGGPDCNRDRIWR